MTVGTVPRGIRFGLLATLAVFCLLWRTTASAEPIALSAFTAIELATDDDTLRIRNGERVIATLDDCGLSTDEELWARRSHEGATSPVSIRLVFHARSQTVYVIRERHLEWPPSPGPSRPPHKIRIVLLRGAKLDLIDAV